MISLVLSTIYLLIYSANFCYIIYRVSLHHLDSLIKLSIILCELYFTILFLMECLIVAKREDGTSNNEQLFKLKNFCYFIADALYCLNLFIAALQAHCVYAILRNDTRSRFELLHKRYIHYIAIIIAIQSLVFALMFYVNYYLCFKGTTHIQDYTSVYISYLISMFLVICIDTFGGILIARLSLYFFRSKKERLLQEGRRFSVVNVLFFSALLFVFVDVYVISLGLKYIMIVSVNYPGQADNTIQELSMFEKSYLKPLAILFFGLISHFLYFRVSQTKYLKSRIDNTETKDEDSLISI